MWEPCDGPLRFYLSISHCGSKGTFPAPYISNISGIFPRDAPNAHGKYVLRIHDGFPIALSLSCRHRTFQVSLPTDITIKSQAPIQEAPKQCQATVMCLTGLQIVRDIRPRVDINPAHQATASSWWYIDSANRAKLTRGVYEGKCVFPHSFQDPAHPKCLSTMVYLGF